MKVDDIDRKDMYTVLSKVTLKLIETYAQSTHLVDWLFPGGMDGKHLSERSVQKVFEMSLIRSGIEKKVSLHTLLDSFATHLLGNGTVLRYIQEFITRS